MELSVLSPNYLVIRFTDIPGKPRGVMTRKEKKDG